MNKFEWNNSLLTGVEKIDTQHKRIFELINNSYEELIVGKEEDDDNKKLILELWDYTIYHFSEEENLMNAINYPYKEEHLSEHINFIIEIGKIRNDEELNLINDSMILIRIVDFLGKWLKNHIMTIDIKLAEYLNTAK